MNTIHEFKGDYGFLSNFYRSEFWWEGYKWFTSESAYQASKSSTSIDFEMFSYLTPGQAKRRGRKLKLRADWEDIKINRMHSILMCKFGQNQELASKLINTGDAILEEGNNWNDKIWGISPPKSGEGENNLGKILMEVRFSLGGKR